MNVNANDTQGVVARAQWDSNRKSGNAGPGHGILRAIDPNGFDINRSTAGEVADAIFDTDSLADTEARGVLTS